jgi:hypothetical protein
MTSDDAALLHALFLCGIGNNDLCGSSVSKISTLLRDSSYLTLLNLYYAMKLAILINHAVDGGAVLETWPLVWVGIHPL